MSVRSMDFSTF